jgi:hypothetical protein
MHNRLCTSTWLLALALLVAFGAADGRAEAVFPLAEVKPGLQGYGMSVFAGFEPERFEVEIIGVWRNLRPGTSYILAELSGHGLEESGVIAGMSGSPVYLDGRLAGAVAFAWPFSHRAVAGITPIEMMREMSAEQGSGAPAVGSTAPTLEQLAAVDLPSDRLGDGVSLLEPAGVGQGIPGILWTTVGFGERSRDLLSRHLGSVAVAGGASADTSGDLVPGSSVAGVLIDGDLRLAVSGTVTDRSGEELLAFGHPFLGVGPLRVPMASAEVVTVLSSRFQSFKVTNIGDVVGAFDLDRVVGIRGRLGVEAPTTPVDIHVRGSRTEEFQVRIADLPLLAPTMVAIAALGSLDAATHAQGDQGLDLDVRFELGDQGELTVRQSFDGLGAAMEAATYLMAYTSFLLNNRLEEVKLTGVDIELTQFEQPRTARLVEAHAAKTIVRPGDRVPVNLDLVAFRGDHFRRSIELELPTGLADGRYSLLVGDGVSVDVARLMIERFEPVTFAQALDFLRSLHSRRQLVVLGIFAGAGLAVAGEVMPQLPGSVRSLWGAAASGSAVPLRLAVAHEDVAELDVPLEGLLRIDLEVKRQEPLASETEGESGEAESGGEKPVASPTNKPGTAAQVDADGKSPRKRGK